MADFQDTEDFGRLNPILENGHDFCAEGQERAHEQMAFEGFRTFCAPLIVTAGMWSANLDLCDLIRSCHA